MNVLGVSAGNGASLFPFKKYLVGNIEVRQLFHTKGDLQWNLNYDIPLIKEADFSKIPKFPIDIIIGHPDCGHSSALRYSRAKKHISAKYNASLNLLLHSILELKPKIFLIENLKGLLKTYSEADLRDLYPKYNLIFHTVSVSAFGNSQVGRIRLVIIGIRKDFWTKKCKIFKKIRAVKPLKTVNQLVGNLKYPDLEYGHIRESDDTKVCMNYKGQKLNLTQIRELWNTEFKHLKKWPVNNGRLRNLPGVYRDKGDNYPSTVRKQNRAFGPTGDVLSPRECAKIQGFPDTFKLYINPDTLQYSLNKARITVTKCFPYEIALWFKKCLTKIELIP